MGKGSQNSLLDTEEKPKLDIPNGASSLKTLYTWEEIRKHNQKNDCWIVVNDIVYNMTSFKKKHPGGAKIIDFYAGQDATVRLINKLFEKLSFRIQI